MNFEGQSPEQLKSLVLEQMNVRRTQLIQELSKLDSLIASLIASKGIFPVEQTPVRHQASIHESGTPSHQQSASPAKAGRGQNRQKIINWLRQNGSASFGEIVSGTGIGGSSVVSVLKKPSETAFFKDPNTSKWSLK